MAKEVVGYLKLQVKGGAANPAPPIGPALGSKGLNIMDFCKQFNAQTQKLEKGLPIPVIITVYSDRSFEFKIKSPPAAVLIKLAAKIPAGKKQGKEVIPAGKALKQTDLTLEGMNYLVEGVVGSI